MSGWFNLSGIYFLCFQFRFEFEKKLTPLLSYDKQNIIWIKLSFYKIYYFILQLTSIQLLDHDI